MSPSWVHAAFLFQIHRIVTGSQSSLSWATLSGNQLVIVIVHLLHSIRQWKHAGPGPSTLFIFPRSILCALHLWCLFITTMTPLGEAHRRDARSYPLGATKFTTRDDDSNEDGDDLSGPDTDDEEVSSQPETREDALDIDSDDDLASDDASDDEDDTEVAEEVRRQINTTQGSTIVPPVENAFVPLPRTSTTRSLGTFHTILPGAPVLRLTPSTSSSVSQTPSATRNASPFQAFSSTTTRIISPQVPTTTPSAPLLSNTLLPSSTPAPPIPSVITNTSTGASSLPTTQASAEATAGAAAGGGLNGGAVAGAAVGGAGKHSPVAATLKVLCCC